MLFPRGAAMNEEKALIACIIILVIMVIDIYKSGGYQ